MWQTTNGLSDNSNKEKIVAPPSLYGLLAREQSSRAYSLTNNDYKYYSIIVVLYCSKGNSI